MAAATDDPLARFERRPSGVPAAVAGALLVLCIAAGIIIALRDSAWQLALIASGSLLLACLFWLLNTSRNRKLAFSADRRMIKWETAMPELQRQNVNLEVRELARLLEVGDEQLGDLLSAYIVAEDLALRQIQQEENLPMLRHVEISGLPFDAVLIEQDEITCVEVSFLVVPELREDKFQAMMKKFTRAKQHIADRKLRLRLKLLIFLVTQLEEEEVELMSRRLLQRKADNTPAGCEIRWHDFESLQRTYLTEN